MGEYIGHLELTLENIEEEKNLHTHENPDAHTTSSVTMKKMMSEQVEPETLNHHATNSNQALRPNLKHF